MAQRVPSRRKPQGQRSSTKVGASAALAPHVDVDALVSHLPDLIFRLDRGLRHVFVGGATHRTGSLRPSKFLGKTGRQLGFPAELCDRFEPVCRSVFRTGKPGVLEFEVRGVWIRHRVVPERNAAGRVETVLVIAEDATGSKSLESNLRESESRSREDLRALKTLVDLGMTNASSEELAPLLRGVVDSAISITGADFGNIKMLDESTHTLRIVASRGFPKWWLRFWETVHVGEGTCGTTLRRGRRTIVEDVRTSPIFKGKPALRVMVRAGVLSVSSTPLHARNGELLGMFSVHSRKTVRPDERTLTMLDLLALQAADLIERARAEKAMRESEEKYRTVFTHMADEVMLWRLVRGRSGRIGTWRLVDINPAGLKGWGKSRDETVGKLADDIFPGETRHYMPVVRKIFAEGREHSWESYFPQLKRHLKMTSVPFGDCFVTTGTDITASKLAAITLHVSEERLRLALQAANMGAFDWDLLSGKITWTPNTERLWGLEPGGFKGTYAHWRSLLHPKDRARCVALVRRALADSRDTYEIEHRIVLPDKSVRWIAARASVLRDSRGKPIRMVGINSDITEQKAARELLESERDRLDRLVRERTEEALRAQQQVRVSERLSSLGTLAAGLGHDMNNMLMPLRAQLEALHADRERLPVRSRRSVTAISRNIAYLQQLADSLHFLAMDPDSDGGDCGETDLAEWWSKTGAVLVRAVPRHVSVFARIPRLLPRACISMHSLTQAVLNLVVNSGAAVPAGRAGRVVISAETEGRDRLRLAISDNGTGMSEETRRRAFDMFFTTKTRGMGTGLGLALVQRVAEHAGGQVEIKSELGRGTTVSLLIPAARAEGPRPRRTAVVSIRDGRARGVIMELLRAWGIAASVGSASGDADIWVFEPDEVSLRQASSWRGRRGGPARLVAVGVPDDPKVKKEWEALSPLTIADPKDFEGLRATLARAVEAH